MTRSVYLIGAAGAGKSTFMADLLECLGAELGPQEDLASKRNAKALVTLRGHSFHDGMYLGKMRDDFPGTDGLDRASSPVAAEWLRAGNLPGRIIGEGATLATKTFMDALAETTELLLIHLLVSPEGQRDRCGMRGSNQAEQFLLGTATRSANLAQYVRTNHSVAVLPVDTEDSWDLELAHDTAVHHLTSV